MFEANTTHSDCRMVAQTAAAKFLIMMALMGRVDSNLRCYSCATCTEFDWRPGDLGRWEQDCLLDRYCMNITGVVTDLYGYGREVSIRGCPWVSLVTKLEEGCQRTTLELTGLGSVSGEICFCEGHLCNSGERRTPLVLFYSSVLLMLR